MTAPPPTVPSEDDLAALRAGLAQRLRALEVVVADARGPQRAVADGVLPGSVLVRAHGYSRQARSAPRPGVALPLAAFDLDRDAGGRWRVVASHAGGASSWPVHHRLDADLADLLDPVGDAVLDAHDPRAPRASGAGARSRRTSVAAALAACAPGAAAVLLAPPGEEGLWAETALAHGVPLVRGSDLLVSGGRLLVRTTSGRSPVGVVLRALGDDELDPVVSDAPGAVHGCPGLLTAVRAGGVVLAPALGAGLVDDEEVRRRTPDLVRWALGEEPLLADGLQPDGPPPLRLVTISDGRLLDVVPGLDGSPHPARPGASESGGNAGAGHDDGERPSVARLWHGDERPSLLLPSPPAVASPAPAQRAMLDLRSRGRAGVLVPELVGEPC